MQQLNFPVIKIVFYLVIGVLIGYYCGVSINLSIVISSIFLILVLISLYVNRRTRKKTVAFGFIAYSLFISLGILTTSFHNEKNHLNHYTKTLNKESSLNPNIIFKVREVLKPTAYHHKYVIDFKSINGQKVTGKSLLNVQKDSIQNQLKVDELVFTSTNIKELNSSLNPYQFDYKSYLNKKQIFNQLVVEKNDLQTLSDEKNTIFGLASKFREAINEKLIKYNFNDDELAIVNALLLGQRQDISKEIYDSYTQAGAIHILAVSGLHVGIILIMLNILFKPIERIKRGRVVKTLIILTLLWCFAIIAGLSASVTRAVTMFSIVTIGMNLKRATNIYNTLAISIFILLLFKPYFLFDVGFQLSYLAVFAIVWIQPLIYNYWKPKIWLIDKFWQIFTVTIAAQLGVAPISLFYFHQFPGLFFVSNLVIIPFLGFILGFGILIIALALLDILPQFLASIFGNIIGWMNDFIAFVSKQEDFLFKHISFEILSVLASYFLIFSVIKLFKHISYRRIILALSSIAIFISVLIFNKYDNATKAFLIFHKSRHSLIGIKHTENLMVHHNLDSLSLIKDKVISNYEVGSQINNKSYDSIHSVYKINDKLLLVIDSLGIYGTSFKPNIVLLINSPKINLNRLIDELDPELIIADGSNYKSFQERWSKTCINRKIPFHQTSKKGAFIVTY